jgi:SecDF, P1 head subdomain
VRHGRSNRTQALFKGRCGFIAHIGSVLGLALLLLYLAATGGQPSVAGVEPRKLALEPAQPTTWQDLLHAGSVLQTRLRVLYPNSGEGLSWTVRSGQLVVGLSPQVPPQWVVDEAMRVGQLEVVEGGTEFLPIGRRIRTGLSSQPELGVYETVLSAAHFVSADVHLRQGRPVIEFMLTPEGDARLAAHASQQRGYYLCLVMDGQVVNCPILRTPLTDRHGFIELTGGATMDTACTWVMLLRSGPLPVALHPAAGQVLP